jgi:hypothetical protein
VKFIKEVVALDDLIAIKNRGGEAAEFWLATSPDQREVVSLLVSTERDGPQQTLVRRAVISATSSGKFREPREYEIEEALKMAEMEPFDRLCEGKQGRYLVTVFGRPLTAATA